ncbi:unnamed protein product [Staurois parvus]|uniref:Uncharacterized protein n=1 Tax=Staurois parvus TaxID=386267 RepID=A0ABN9DIW5_9NEOB|nr:unnamed protein product [Staurois parvus]
MDLLECRNIPTNQGRTDNSWGPRAIGEHEAPCVLCQTQKKPMKKVPGASLGAPY